MLKEFDELESVVNGILGGHLVTAQTNSKGKKGVNKVLIAEDAYAPDFDKTSEFYMSVLLNRDSGKNIIMYSTEGGMNIEEVAEKHLTLFLKKKLIQVLEYSHFQCRKIAFNLRLSGKSFKEMTKFVHALYTAYVGCDASLFEINPVLRTCDDRIIAVDSKVSFLDGNALYRHPDYKKMRDLDEEDPIDVEADQAGL